MTVYSFSTGQPIEPQRNTRGRRKGAHGNRVPDLMKQRIIEVLTREADPRTGRLTGKLVQNCALMAGCSTETVYAVWREARARITAATTTDVEAGSGSVSVTPSPLLRGIARANGAKRLTLTTAEIAWIAQFPNRIEAYRAATADEDNRLGRYSDRSFYRACDDVHPSTWAGLGIGPGKSEQAARAAEAHPYRPSRGTVSQSMTLDQSQVKGRVEMPDGSVVETVQLLPVTWEASGLTVAYEVLTDRGRTDDASRVIGEAVRGFTYDDFRVEGAGLFLRTDQAAEYVSDELARRVRHVGMGMNPGESHSPRGNGDGENVFSILDPMLRMIPGSGQWVTDRSGARYFTGVIAWTTLLEVIDEAFRKLRFELRFTQGEWEGWTRFDKHRELIRRGALKPVIPPAGELVHLAVTVDTRQYKPTKGVWFRGRYYLSRELADNVKRNSHHLKDVSIRTLVDESEIFLTDSQGVFLGTAVPREEQDDLDKAGLLADRGTRTGIRKTIIKSVAGDMVAAGQASVRNQTAQYANATAEPEEPTAPDEAGNGSAGEPTTARPAPAPSPSPAGRKTTRRRAARKSTSSRKSRGRSSAPAPLPLADFVAAFGDGLGNVSGHAPESPQPAVRPPRTDPTDQTSTSTQESPQ